MPDATITSTASTFGTITGTFAADQSTVTGTITGTVAGTLTGSVGVPGPAGPGVPAGGTAGQYLQKTTTGVDYATDWVTLNLSAYAPLNSPAFTGDPTAPTAALGDNDTSLATTAFVQQELASGVAVAKNLEVYVRNQSGSTIPAGSIVYISGATGNRPLITLAQANNDANSAQTMGFTKTAIANNGFGYVIVRGELENIDTSALTEGAQLYLSPTVAGTWTTTKPSAPQHLVYVGIVVRAHPTQGIILVAVQNGYELNELHDVAITSPTNGQVLKYNSSTNLWVNGTDSAGVAWGGITGTLSSQTDLQTALDGKYSTSNPAGYITSSALTPYLTSATAASTYQTLAGMSSYLTSATAASTYQTLAGMSSYALKTDGALKGNFTLDGTASSPNSDGSILIGSSSTGYSYLNLQAGVIQGVTYSGGNKSFTLNGLEGLKLFSSGQGVRFPDATTQTTAYPGSSDFLLKADNLSGLASTSTARTNLGLGTMATATAADYSTTTVANGLYYPLSSNPAGYLTSAPVTSVAGKTGAVTLVVGDVSGAAPTASPTLTGTPTAPTATAGTNTTQIATTAFVTAAVPAFAETTNVIFDPSSTTLALNPSLVPQFLANSNYRNYSSITQSSVLGSAAVSQFGSSRELYTSSTTASGRATYMNTQYAQSFMSLSSKSNSNIIDWSKKIWVFGTAILGRSTYVGNANTVTRINLGGRSTNATGNLTSKGIGLFKVGGTSTFINLTVHNGTTLTNVASSVTLASDATVHYVIYSDGAGNVQLYLDGTLAASSTAGPTGNGTSGHNVYEEQIESAASSGSLSSMHVAGAGIYMSR